VRAGWLLTWCLVGCGAEIGGDDPSTDGAPRLVDAAVDRADAVPPPDAAPPQTTLIDAASIVDTFLRFNNPALNYGITERLCADTTTDDRRVLLRIDVSSLPTDIEVVSADLHIWTSTSTNDLSTQTFSVYRMLESWNEGSQDAATGFASWDDRKSGTGWTVAGAGVGSRDDVVMGSFVPAAIDTEYIVPLEPEIVAGWVADPASNFGAVIVAAGQDGGCFASSEAATASRRPSLSVTWLAR
jgi:hypothetical protein